MSGQSRGQTKQRGSATSLSSSESLADVVARLSRSNDIEERQKTRDSIKLRLDAADEVLAKEVDANHDSFYLALEAFQQVTVKMEDSKDKVNVLRRGLKDCKKLLRLKREQVHRLWFDRTEYAEMLRLLDQIEEIKKVPETVDALMASKDHVKAATLLVETATALEGKSLGAVRALHDLYRKLNDRMEQMRKVVTSELQNNIYLKSNLEQMAFGASGFPEGSAGVADREAVEAAQPSNDPFHYLSRSVEALGVLQTIPELIVALRGTLKAELSLMIDKAVAAAKKEFAADDAASASQVLVDRGDGFMKDGPTRLLRFLTFLYERVFRVFVSHCHVLAAIRRAPGGAAALKSASGADSYSAQTIWNGIQIEVELFLCIYLELDENAVVASPSFRKVGTMPGQGAAQSAAGVGEHAAATLFSFANSLNAMTETAAKAERAINDGVAGTVLTGEEDIGYRGTSGTDTSENLLCPKTPHNITGIFQPTLLFVAEMEEELMESKVGEQGQGEAVSAYDSRASLPISLKDFVGSFLKNKFVHIIKKTIFSDFKKITDTADKPLDDHGIEGAPRILFKSTLSVHLIMGRLCGYILDLPSVAHDFAALMARVLSQYKLTVQYKYKSLAKIRRPGLKKDSVAVSAGLEANVQMQALARSTPWWKTFFKLDLAAEGESPGVPPVPETPDGVGSASETDLLLTIVGDRFPTKTDIISDSAKLKSIAYMHESLHWFANQVGWVAECLKNDRKADLAGVWPDDGPIVGELLEEEDTSTVRSTVGPEQADKLTELAAEFLGVAESCLVTLRLELRVHCLHFLLPTLRKSSYQCTADQIEEADPQVVALCKDILMLDETLQVALQPNKYEIVFAGIGDFLATFLIRNIVHIKKVNDMGIKRICRSIFALQQTLRTVCRPQCANAVERAMAYYEMLNLQPEQVLEAIVIGGQTFAEEEYMHLLNLTEASQNHPDEATHANVLTQLKELFHELV